jgi:hypothetical protein
MVSMKTITIRPMGGNTKRVTVPSNATIKTILSKAGIEVDASKVKMIANGTHLSLKSTMGKHSELLIIPTVKGGR